MTCSLALRNPRLFAPEYPDALSSTARRCFLPWTERFTLAIVTASCVRGDRLPPRFGYRPRRRPPCFRSPPPPPAGATGPPARLLLEQVRTKRLPAADLPRPRDLVALGCAPVRLHLRHHCSPSLPFPPACTARARAGRLVGFSTIVMLRPSWRGADSTTAMSPTCSATRSRIRRPSSGWNTSRPRNMIVSLTFEPSARKRSTCFIFVS